MKITTHQALKACLTAACTNFQVCKDEKVKP